MEARRRPVDAGPAVTASVPGAAGAARAARGGGRAGRSSRFSYRGTARRLDPYGLLLRDGFWYVLGRDHGHDELRTYRVDRIEGDVAITGEDGAVRAARRLRPRDGVPERGQAASASSATAVDGPRAHRRRAGRRVEREVGSDRVVARRRNGAIEVVVPFANAAAFASWVLGLADHAEVLSPKAVRERLVARLRALSNDQCAGRRRSDEQTAPGRRSERGAEARLAGCS